MDNYLLDNVDKIRHIPCIIIQGRYDVTTPMKTAWDLHKVGQGMQGSSLILLIHSWYYTMQRWPEAEFHVVPDAGHFFLEPATIAKLIEATNKYKNL